MDIQTKINQLAADMKVHPRDTKLLLQFTVNAMQDDKVADRFVELYQAGDMEAVEAITEAYIEAAVTKVQKITEIFQTRQGAKAEMGHRVLDLMEGK